MKTYETWGYMIGGLVGIVFTALSMHFFDRSLLYLPVLIGGMLGGAIGVQIPKKDKK